MITQYSITCSLRCRRRYDTRTETRRIGHRYNGIKPAPPRSQTGPPCQIAERLVIYNPTTELFTTHLLLRRQSCLRSIIVTDDGPVANWLGVFPILAQNLTGLETLVVSGITFIINTAEAAKMLTHMSHFLSVSMFNDVCKGDRGSSRYPRYQQYEPR